MDAIQQHIDACKKFRLEAKPGDECYIYRLGQYTKTKVQRVTKTTIIADDCKFRRKDGHQVGTLLSRHITCIEPVTPEREAQIETAKKVLAVRLKWRGMGSIQIHESNFEAIDKIIDILKKTQGL